MHKLVVLAGGPRGSELVLADDNVTVGRDEDNTIQVDDESVWHHHAVFVRNCQTYFVRNLSTRNGTLLNGLPIQEARLKSGDRIRLGRLELRFDTVAEPAAAESNFVEEAKQQDAALTIDGADHSAALEKSAPRATETVEALRRLHGTAQAAIAAVRRARRAKQDDRHVRGELVLHLADLTEQLIAARRRFPSSVKPLPASNPMSQTERKRLASELVQAQQATARLETELSALQAQATVLAQRNDELAGQLAQAQADLARARRCFAEHNAAEFQQIRLDLAAKQSRQGRRRTGSTWQRGLCFLSFS
jgi:predicted  nucleic acid-binding Zn-ribbon protein